MSPNQKTQDFILAHRNDDVRTLALKRQGTSDVDMVYALEQIDGWQRARRKLPMWAEHQGVVYPPHISMEQCSSEATALYKQRLVRTLIPDIKNAKIADLTGGFGVDFSYMSRDFKEAFYIEKQQALCDIARHNFAVLEMSNSKVVHGVAEDVLPTLPQLDVVYLDPARRDIHGKKTYAISDCTPDVTVLLPDLLAKAAFVIVKLSPMLDHREAVRLLPGVSEIHIISVRNECKETLLVITKDKVSPRIFCVDDDNIFVTDFTTNNPSPVPQLTTPLTSNPSLLYVPNASVMKSGCFDALCRTFRLVALDRNSHLFVPDSEYINSDENVKNIEIIDSFPGRVFRITAVTTLNKKALRKALSGIKQANIAVRNFPLSVDALKAKINGICKLRDGGTTYIFATTIKSQYMLLITEKY